MARVDEFSIKLQSYSGNLIGFSVQDEKTVYSQRGLVVVPGCNNCSNDDDDIAKALDVGLIRRRNRDLQSFV
jgi:hypothetical protein